MKLLSFPTEEKKRMQLAAVIFFLVLLIVRFLSSTTSDEGDSVLHYLFAKYAFKYPEHFFQQWAKPVYVLVMAPFAQLGFKAVQIANLALTAINFYLVYRLAAKLLIPKAWMASFIYASIPLAILISMSGLTEPLFACVLLLSMLLFTEKRYYAGLILLSFLPFVRSEGLVVCCVLLIYLFVIEKYELIPLLATGHIVYGLAGSFVHGNVMWVFTKLSYATLTSAYGSGKWGHFFNVMPEITGIVVQYLLWIGMFFGFILFVRYLRRKLSEHEVNEIWLVYAVFASVFFGHTIFWALGIFNSMGLIRPFAGVAPFIAIIALRGIQYISSPLQQWAVSKYLQYGLLALILIFPYTSSIYAYKWERDWTMKADQRAQLRLIDFIKTNYPDYKQHTFYHVLPWVSVQLKQDWFDAKQHIHINDAFRLNQFKTGDFFIWDDWFAVVEGNATLEAMEKDIRFEKIKTEEEKDYWGNVRKTILFRYNYPR
jgi:hypothetical protein